MLSIKDTKWTIQRQNVIREEGLRLAGEDRSPKKWVEAGTNYGSWRLIEVERTHR
jgi:hypothetical protein